MTKDEGLSFLNLAFDVSLTFHTTVDFTIDDGETQTDLATVNIDLDAIDETIAVHGFRPLSMGEKRGMFDWLIRVIAQTQHIPNQFELAYLFHKVYTE